MKKKKLTQRQRQSLRERSAKPGRLIRPDEKPKLKVEINKTVIDYNIWYTWGNKLTYDVDRIYNPALLDTNGFRCVFGFVCQSLGISDKDLKNLSSTVKSPKYIKEFRNRFNTELAEKAMEINDVMYKKISEKIGFLIELLNRYNFELYFINLPTYVYNDVEEQYLDRVSTSKGPHIFASTDPVWKTQGKMK